MKITDLIDITESFDATFDNIIWQQQNTTLIGTATMGDEEFILELGLQSISLNDTSYKYVTIEFYTVTDGVPSQELTGNNKNQSKIFGCIKNAFIGKIQTLDKKFGIDAVVTLVKTNHENKPLKRLGLYKLMFAKLQGNGAWVWVGDFEFSNLIGSIFAKHLPNSATITPLKRSIASRGKENI